jgi:hypothetical protein
VLFQHCYRRETAVRVPSQREFQQSRHQESKPLSLVACILRQFSKLDAIEWLPSVYETGLKRVYSIRRGDAKRHQSQQ